MQASATYVCSEIFKLFKTSILKNSQGQLLLIVPFTKLD